MKEYLAGKTGKTIGILRAGMPKEVYFEAKVKEISGELVILEDKKGQEIALPIDKIILIGPPEKNEACEKKVGF